MTTANDSIKFSTLAALNIEEGSVDIAADVARVRAGLVTAEELLSQCVNGADDDRVQGWREYVSAVVAAAGPVATDEPIAALRNATGAAQRAWKGLDWHDGDNDVCHVAKCLRDVVEADEESSVYAGRTTDTLRDIDGVSSWVANDGAYSHQQHHEGLTKLGRLIDDSEFAEALELAEGLAKESRMYVAARAQEASEEGNLAVEAAERGDWDEAVARLQSACRSEREFGDAPTWSGVLTLAEAIVKGAEDGIADVDTVLDEQGVDTMIATLAPGHTAWDEGAINAGAAGSRRIPEHLHEVYYRAYAEAARKRAQEIADEPAVAVRYQVQVRGAWGGRPDDGRWRPAITGTLNQSIDSDEDVSTVDTLAEAEELLQLCESERDVESTAKFRISKV